MSQRTSNRLEEQSAIITGASSGIGKAIAIGLAKAGANVMVNYHTDEAGADHTLAEIVKLGNDVIAVKQQADVSQEDSVTEMFAKAVEIFGTVDIVVANAGLQKDAPLHEMELSDWQLVIDVNLTGQFLCARAAIREFLRRGMREGVSRALGKIIHISSVHEIIPWAGHANYAASKSAITMLMQSIAQGYGQHKIRCNSIAPGAIRTAINKQAWETKEAEQKLLQLIPYGRIGETEDVADMCTWLASDEADYVNGTTLFIDGGMTAYPGFSDNG